MSKKGREKAEQTQEMRENQILDAEAAWLAKLIEQQERKKKNEQAN